MRHTSHQENDYTRQSPPNVPARGMRTIPERQNETPAPIITRAPCSPLSNPRSNHHARLHATQTRPANYQAPPSPGKRAPHNVLEKRARQQSIAPRLHQPPGKRLRQSSPRQSHSKAPLKHTRTIAPGKRHVQPLEQSSQVTPPPRAPCPKRPKNAPATPDRKRPSPRTRKTHQPITRRENAPND